EFEDFPWLPKIIRTGLTNLLVVLHRLSGTTEVIADLISQAKAKTNFSQVVDLGSGSGGAMPDVIERINAADPGKPIRLILTDLHPNPDFIRLIQQQYPENVTYKQESVDATNFL